MAKLFIVLGALSGATGVMLGAFAAHALKGRLDAAQISAFQTGVQYQMIHALALVATGILLQRGANPLLQYAGFSFTAGIILFSGSLYLLTTTSMRWPGPVTPLGGLAFIAAWLLMLVAVLRY